MYKSLLIESFLKKVRNRCCSCFDKSFKTKLDYSVLLTNFKCSIFLKFIISN